MSRFFIFILCVLFVSCEIINPEEELSSQLFIDEILFDTTQTTNSFSSKITDAWVYFDDEFIGVYPIPSVIPVLKVGTKDIIVNAGIKKNGISASRVSYPFYKSFNTTKLISPNQICTIYPTVSYKINNFSYEENFEGNGTTLNVLTDSINHTIEKIYSNLSDSILGNNFGKISINGQNGEIFECKTNNISLPKDREVYLELEYKSNATFVVGIYANYEQSNSSKSAIIYINEKEDWNKTYLSLSETINYYGNSVVDYNIFIGMSRDTTLISNELFIDNLRIVHE